MPRSFAFTACSLAVASAWGARAVAQTPPAARDTAVMSPIVVVTARGDEALRVAPFAASVLYRGQLPRTDPGLSLAAALAGVPGVASQNRYSLARDESLSIRGFGARSAFGIRGVRILLDGIPQTLPDGQGQLTNVDLSRLTRVEVLRGAASALQGNATGGVVSLSTDYTPPPRPLLDARALAGGNGLLVFDAGLGMGLGRGALLVDASRQAGDGHRAQDRFEIWRGGARASFPLGGVTRLTVVSHVARMPEAQDPGALTATELAADRSAANPGNERVNAGKRVTQAQAGVTLDREWAGTRMTLTGFTLARDFSQRLPFATIAFDRWVWGGRYEGRVTVASAARPTIVWGIDAQWQRDDRTNRSPTTDAVTRDQLETVRELGPFAQLRVRPVDRVSLLGGVRVDQVAFRVVDRFLADGDDTGDRTLSALSGTGGAALELTRDLVLYGNVGTSFETPTTTELGNQPDGSGGFNPDLKPQRAVQFEAGARLQAGVASVSVAAYRANVRDALISYEVPSDPGRRYFRNAGRTRHQGLELESRVFLSSGVHAELAYTLADLRFVDFATDDARYDGNRVPGVPTHLGRLGLGLLRGPLTADVEVRAASATWADDANTARADGWWVSDLAIGATARLGAWRFTPRIGVENLFDETYVAAVAVNGAAGRYYEPAPGRSLYVSLSIAPR